MYMSAVLKGAEAAETKTDFEENSCGGSCSVRELLKQLAARKVRRRYTCISCKVVVFGATAPQWAMASSFTRFLDNTEQRTTVGRTPLDEWPARRRDLYLTTHNNHNSQTSKPPV